MFSPIRTESGFIGQSQHCSLLASCGHCAGTDLPRTEMRIAEGVGSEWLGCCKRFLAFGVTDISWYAKPTVAGGSVSQRGKRRFSDADLERARLLHHYALN